MAFRDNIRSSSQHRSFYTPHQKDRFPWAEFLQLVLKSEECHDTLVGHVLGLAMVLWTCCLILAFTGLAPLAFGFVSKWFN